jgi:hypothetical protein
MTETEDKHKVVCLLQDNGVGKVWFEVVDYIR